VFSQFVNAVFISVGEQDDTVVFCGHVRVTSDSLVTVKLAAQVLVSQVLVTVNVTVVVPPQDGGASPPLLVTEPRLHPPLAVAVRSQAAY
jgi:hypothetical protein